MAHSHEGEANWFTPFRNKHSNNITVDLLTVAYDE